MQVAELIERLERAGPPGQRTSPRGPAEPGQPRGDHDLNPEFYEPEKALQQAAVLVPIVARQGAPTVLLTRRTDHLHHHPGQISFPGGRLDAGDSGPEAAALRETEEEIGLERQQIRLLGRLDTYVVRTGFAVVPFVGLISPPFSLTLDAFEVAEAFEVPLAFFLAPENRERHARIFEGKERRFYAYPYRDYYIWGATAGMLNNLSEILTAGSKDQPT